MTVLELVTKTRSCRRFYEKEPIGTDQLKALVDLARLSPSAGNLQPLKYIISNNAGKNLGIFSCLAWAGSLKDWPGPVEGERPAGYIIIVGDRQLATDFGCEHGIAAQSIALGTTEMGFGCCMIGSIKKDRLAALLRIPPRYDVLLVVALGKPKEKIVLEEIKGSDIKYWRDENEVHHVPKRTLEELIFEP
ncbi:MAG: nitroreductase family protein [Syntrophorhabdaceae bacterium]|nr:nitroreductase family protein [Syntrophorhabdaceae bacterium]MDD4196774.1 nitroreductase family protein [Syntrophorhabdaceae bacterium]